MRFTPAASTLIIRESSTSHASKGGALPRVGGVSLATDLRARAQGLSVALGMTFIAQTPTANILNKGVMP